MTPCRRRGGGASVAASPRKRDGALRFVCLVRKRRVRLHRSHALDEFSIGGEQIERLTAGCGGVAAVTGDEERADANAPFPIAERCLVFAPRDAQATAILRRRAVRGRELFGRLDDLFLGRLGRAWRIVLCEGRRADSQRAEEEQRYAHRRETFVGMRRGMDRQFAAA